VGKKRGFSFRQLWGEKFSMRSGEEEANICVVTGESFKPGEG